VCAATTEGDNELWDRGRPSQLGDNAGSFARPTICNTPNHLQVEIPPGKGNSSYFARIVAYDQIDQTRAVLDAASEIDDLWSRNFVSGLAR
jgi:hypothetical protein